MRKNIQTMEEFRQEHIRMMRVISGTERNEVFEEFEDKLEEVKKDNTQPISITA